MFLTNESAQVLQGIGVTTTLTLRHVIAGRTKHRSRYHLNHVVETIAYETIATAKSRPKPDNDTPAAAGDSFITVVYSRPCLLYTSDAADE